MQPQGLSSPYDGVLNVWFNSELAKQKTYASPLWTVVAQHELLLLQPQSLTSLSVDEYVVLDRPISKADSYIKLIIASQDQMIAEEFIGVMPDVFR